GGVFVGVEAEPAALAYEGFLTGCNVADAAVAQAASALRSARVEFGVDERDGLSKRITLLPAPAAKGFEFDAVVVVEPAAIAAGGARGLRLLYVTLTRPIQHLS